MKKPSVVVARESQHTQLPWEVVDGGNSHCELEIHSEDSVIAFVLGGSDNHLPLGKNAEFIVRACNSHHALIDALQAIFSTKALYAWVSEKGIGDSEWKRRSAIIQQAEQALRLAQGKE